MKLCVLDKDGTLVRPASGAEFPQSPTDQELLPGVKEAIDRMRATGWTFAIASNQGGCDWHDSQAMNLKPGDLFRGRHEDDNLYGKTYKVVGVEKIENGIEVDALFNETRWHVDKWVKADIGIDFRFTDGDRVLVQYKTIEEAIEEMQFAADLCGIRDFAFCPESAGEKMICQIKATVDGVDRWMPAKQYHEDDYNIGKFRKPSPGMLNFFERMFSPVMPGDRAIMIGDRPEDEAAADAAGFRFLDASEWRSGADVEEVRSFS